MWSKMGYMTEEDFNREMRKIQQENKQIELKNKLRYEKAKVRRQIFPKMTTSNKVLVVAIMAIVLFSIACLYIQCRTSVEVSSTLITLWFSFWTVEIVSLAGIKVSKVFKEHKDATNDEQVELISDANTVG